MVIDVLGKNWDPFMIRTLFSRIDANSDGQLTWSEFSEYSKALVNIVIVSNHDKAASEVIMESGHRVLGTPHREDIIKLEFVAKERKYVSVSRDGIVSLWNLNMELHRTIDIMTLNTTSQAPYWIQDAKYIHEHSKLVLVSDDRQLRYYDIFGMAPRLIAKIISLEHTPLCITIAEGFEENLDLLIFGDDGGYLNILRMHRRFLIEKSGESKAGEIQAAQLLKSDSFQNNNISLTRYKYHTGWVDRVNFYSELNSVLSCCKDEKESMVFTDLLRRTSQTISIPKGITCFDMSKRPCFIVTGGRDRCIRLWYNLYLSLGTLIY